MSLRTNKADVIVGIEKDIAERLDNSGEKWRVDGQYVAILLLCAQDWLMCHTAVMPWYPLCPSEVIKCLMIYIVNFVPVIPQSNATALRRTSFAGLDHHP